METFTQIVKEYIDWRDHLSKDQKVKFDLIMMRVNELHNRKFTALISKHFLRSEFSITYLKKKDFWKDNTYDPAQYLNNIPFWKNELSDALKSLTEIDLNMDFGWVSVALTGIINEIKTKGEAWPLHDPGLIRMQTLCYSFFSSAEVIEDYLSSDIDIRSNSKSSLELKLTELNKITDLITRFEYLVFLLYIDITGIQRPPKKTINFSELFRAEYRNRIPKEVIRLLGPGQADAWQKNSEGEKDWTYDTIEGSVIVPFYLLVRMGYIDLPKREKNKYITAWLKEFGVKYKDKTFDKPPKSQQTQDHFSYYLNRLK